MLFDVLTAARTECMVSLYSFHSFSDSLSAQTDLYEFSCKKNLKLKGYIIANVSH